MMPPIALEKIEAIVRDRSRMITYGRVARITGLAMEVHIQGMRIGSVVEIERGDDTILGEVVGFKDDRALVIPISDVRGVEPGARVRESDRTAGVLASDALLGRAIDCFGKPVDGGAPLPTSRSTEGSRLVAIDAPAPRVDDRSRISELFETGIRSIDGLLTCGKGQRVGLFAGAGVGKTVLIRQIASLSKVDVIVFGLVGERGGEVRDLLETEMGKNTTVVVATSDRSPMERVRGALAATAIAEFFRDQQKNVLLVIDSLTRYAMALREIGLAAGEPPATKGYPPSVFAALPRLLERVAPSAKGGSITAFYTVLVEGDDLSDPVADSARSLLDGHIVLSRDLAARGHFPAIDVLSSASRVARHVMPAEEQALADRARAILATKREADELKSIGAYTHGANPAYDEAVLLGSKILEWSRQRPRDRSAYSESIAGLRRLLSKPNGGAR